MAVAVTVERGLGLPQGASEIYEGDLIADSNKVARRAPKALDRLDQSISCRIKLSACKSSESHE